MSDAYSIYVAVVDPVRGLPPALEFDTVRSWLAALPPETVIRLEADDGTGWVRLSTAGQVVDGMALAEVLERRSGIEYR